MTLTAALALAAACTEPPAVPSGALRTPMDLAYACEGEGQTVAPENDETAAQFDSTRMCPDLEIPSGAGTRTVQGHLFGLMLSRTPPGVMVLQMNPATVHGRRVLDGDPFVPGYSRIPVGDAPIRILRTGDWSSFYVLTAAAPEVTRMVIEGFQDRGELTWSSSTFPLPGIPSDGVMLGDELLVSAAHEPVLWSFDLTSDPSSPALATLDLPAPIQQLTAVGDRLVVTWVGRPVVSVLRPGEAPQDAGIGPACADSLDNDGDGLADGADPDCRDAQDDDETGQAVASAGLVLDDGELFFAGAAPCEDGLDNDGDGWTDGDDSGCQDGDPDGELRPACQNGLDDDGDGWTDMDDTACYGPHDTAEGQLRATGPYGLTVVEGGDAGSFVYVLDSARHGIHVYGLGETLTRLDAAAHDVTVPALPYKPYVADFTGEASELDPVRAAGMPALAAQGETWLPLPAVGGMSLGATRLRGELWERLIAPDPDEGRAALDYGLPGTDWRPTACDPERDDLCLQPAGDDDTWFVLMPRMDGRIQLFQSIRRGVPVHRTMQRITDPGQRGTDLSKPRLSLRGRSIPFAANLLQGYPFLGPPMEEEIAAAVPKVSPRAFRRFGVWPPEDPELALIETWHVTYEGALPHASGVLGRLEDGDLFRDPAAEFCGAGVQVDDWLVLEAAPGSLAPALRLDAPSVTVGDEPCPLLPIHLAEVEVPVVEVGLTTLRIDPSRARLRPLEPKLDEATLAAEKRVSLSACQAALETFRSSLTWPENLPATEDFAAENLPRRVTYRVHAAKTWIVVGERSGYLHDQAWIGGACAADLDLDPHQTGRLETVSLAEDYATCPPGPAQIGADGVDGLTGGAARFSNWSFGLQAFPGCVTDDQGHALVPTQRDTRWSFDFFGPDNPRTVSAQEALLGTRVSLLDFRRNQVQLDTSGGAVHLLEIRTSEDELLVSFE